MLAILTVLILSSRTEAQWSGKDGWVEEPGAKSLNVEGDPGHSYLDPARRVVAQMPLLIEVQIVMRCDVMIRREQEATGAAGWIADNFLGMRPDAVDEPIDECARSEILSRFALGFFRVLLESFPRERRTL